MEKSTSVLLTCSLLVSLTFVSCQETTEKQDQTAYQQSVAVPATTDAPVNPPEEKIQEEPVYYPANPVIAKSVSLKNNENLSKTEYTVRDRLIDSLNKIIPVYNKEKYSKVSVSYFTSLAHSLGGRTYFAAHADSLTSAIMDILTSRLDDGTDIVFLIDKTGSMDDDLEKVKQSIDMMMNYISQFNNVKLGVASYGDKNYQYDFWYNRTDLSSDPQQIKSYMESFTTIGNPDVAESVNDAIVKTVREMNWTEGSKRLMLVIGDAPSQQPPLSSFTEEKVIAVCDSMHVKFNLYPIILSVTPDGQRDTPFEKDFVKTYPNPVNQFLNADFDEEDEYFFELNDISGRKILSNRLSDKSSTINMSSVSNGSYLLQIYNQNTDKYYSSKIIIQH